MIVFWIVLFYCNIVLVQHCFTTTLFFKWDRFWATLFFPEHTKLSRAVLKSHLEKKHWKVILLLFCNLLMFYSLYLGGSFNIVFQFWFQFQILQRLFKNYVSKMLISLNNEVKNANEGGKKPWKICYSNF